MCVYHRKWWRGIYPNSWQGGLSSNLFIQFYTILCTLFHVSLTWIWFPVSLRSTLFIFYIFIARAYHPDQNNTINHRLRNNRISTFRHYLHNRGDFLLDHISTLIVSFPCTIFIKMIKFVPDDSIPVAIIPQSSKSTTFRYTWTNYFSKSIRLA